MLVMSDLDYREHFLEVRSISVYPLAGRFLLMNGVGDFVSRREDTTSGDFLEVFAQKSIPPIMQLPLTLQSCLR
jgi:hypothetical protein